METYYLVDFENVGSSGVSKCGELSKTDHLHIFYTENNKKIDLDIVDSHGDAELKTHKVPTKSQSVDMHIVSYMGYLLGKNEGKGIEIVIISKDKDYDNLITFWKEKAKISRKQKIDVKSQKTTKPQQPKETKKTQKTTSQPKEIKKTQKATAQSKQKTKAPNESEIRSRLNTDIQKAMAENDYDRKSINGVAKLVVKAYGKDNFLREVHNSIEQHYKDHVEIYKIVKPIITKYNEL